MALPTPTHLAGAAGSRTAGGVRRTDPALVKGWLAEGSWDGRALIALLRDAADRTPDRVALVGRGGPSDGPERLTYEQLRERVHAYACGLADLGVGPGDAVAVMLPNVTDFAALIWAVMELGAVYTGIPVAYGEREVRVILARSHAKVLVMPARVKDDRQLALARRLRPTAPDLEHLVVAGSPAEGLGEGERLLTDLLGAAPRALPDPHPFALCHLGFTSGTTGEPKGVENTAQTLGAVLRGFLGHIGTATLGTPAVNLVASPIGHHTGFLWGVLLSAATGATAVLLETWDPDRAADAVEREGVTVFFGAPTFLQDLLGTRLAGTRTSLHTAVLAGAPVPRDLPARAEAQLGLYVCPAWGMTEWGIGLACRPTLSPAAHRTDGVPVGACEVRIVDGVGVPVADEAAGTLQIRGPGLFLGYHERPDATDEAFDSDGWFTTGDLAVRHADGTVSLAGRTKDIVIRGGENIPVTEVESLLFTHPYVLACAVVGVPDPRLGERACAVVVPRQGAEQELTLASLCGFLSEQGLSKHFLPERLELVEQLPMTPSGKIRKNELRTGLAGG